MIELIILGIILLLYFGYISFPSATILGGICLGGLCLGGICIGGDASETEIRMLNMLNDMVDKPNNDAWFKPINGCDVLTEELKDLETHSRRTGCKAVDKCQNKRDCPHLTLDGYNKFHKIAFEYDGPIHYTLYKEHNGQTKELEDKTALGSIRKIKIFQERNIKFIQVPYTIPCGIVSYIEWDNTILKDKDLSYLEPICQDYLGSRLLDFKVLNPKYSKKYIDANNKYTSNYIPKVKNPPITISDDLKRIDEAKKLYGDGTPDFIRTKEDIYTDAHNNMEATKRKYLEAILLYRLIQGGGLSNIHYNFARITLRNVLLPNNVIVYPGTEYDYVNMNFNIIKQLFEEVFDKSNIISDENQAIQYIADYIRLVINKQKRNLN